MTYGCYNRAPFKESFWADDKEYKPGGGPTHAMKVKVPFRMSPPCMYRHTELGKADPKCVGCIWKDAKELT